MKRIVLLLFFLQLFACTLFAQKQNVKTVISDWGDIQVRVKEFKQKADSVVVDFDLVFEDFKIAANKSLEVIPLIKGGSDSLYLPKIALKGARQAKEFKRELSLGSTALVNDYLDKYLIIQKFDKDIYNLNYRFAVPAQKWMETAELDCLFDFCGCGTASEYTLKDKFAELNPKVPEEPKVTEEPIKKDYVIKPEVGYIEPKKEVVKERMKESIAFLDFIVNQTVIRPEYRNNIAELRKIDELFGAVNSAKGVTIKKVEIVGYASPEGTYKWNEWLSTGRAKALKNYIVNRFGIPEHMFYLQFGGENWDGLVEMVTNSDMQYKEEVLHIIRTVPIFGGREKQLMDLKVGNPYRYMLKHMFPALRKSICRVFYNVESFDADEVKEVIQSNPENLSLYEMYDYAKTDRYIRSKEKDRVNVYEKAAETFPQEDIANINAAQSAIVNGNLYQAEAYLNKVTKMRDSAEFLNSLAMVKLYHGNYGEAMSLLKRAAAMGFEPAKRNLSQIEEYRAQPENYKKIIF